MATDIELALMAGRAYESTRGETNWFPTPQGWSLIDQDEKSSGFEAVTFQRGDEIVISFAGTCGSSDMATDVALASGNYSQQLQEAAEYYLQVKTTNPDAKITLTGHSLGGGLASLIAVFFDEEAMTFDQAPFRAAAESHNLQSPDAYAFMLSVLQDNDQIDQSLLQPLEEYVDAMRQESIDMLQEREQGVTNIRVDGEFLSSWFGVRNFDIIGTTPTENLLIHGSTDIGGISLHSISLLTAFLQCPDFREVTNQLTDLLGMIFDEKLYAYETDPGSINTNFLEHLIRYEFGNAPGVTDTDMLTRFTNDMVKIGEAGGIIASNNSLQKMLIAFAMQAYYKDGGLVESGELFDTKGGNGNIHFSLEKVADSLAGTKGYQEFFQGFLASIPEQEQTIIEERIFSLKDWYLHSTDGAMTATASGNESFMLGGSYVDTLTGSDKGDLLYGMDGDDTLSGYAGNDYLEGGKGRDTMFGGGGDDTFFIMGKDEAYDLFNGGSGTDTIQGGAQDDTIRVRSLTAADSIEVIDGGAGENIIAGTEEGNTIDLSGMSLSHIDRIEGGGGIDIITGSNGRDLIYGGAMGDTLRGMAGDDTLYGIQRDGSDDYLGDRLEGGSGNDTYHVGLGDIIADADKQGVIWFEGQQLPLLSLAEQGEGFHFYESADKQFQASLDEASNTLSVTAGTNPSYFSIENFVCGDFGITLSDYTPPPSLYDLTLNGTDSRDELAYLNLGANGRLAFTAFPDGVSSNTPFYQTPLPAEAPSMEVFGGQGGDFLFGFAGHDHLDGGDGSDIINGYMGSWNGVVLYENSIPEGDLLEGGAGNDYISGSGGDDTIDGGADNDIIQSYDGEDKLSGGSGNDVLAGGSDDVVIQGGDGDDALFGDGYFTGTGSLDLDNLDQLSLRLSYSAAGYASGFTSSNFEIHNDAPNAGDDYLAGGMGRDYIEGGGGNDILLGEADHDTLFGGDGNDNLSGGAGNDWLVGDNSDLSGTGDDLIKGGDGDDLLYGLAGNDRLFGEQGQDQLFGHGGDDLLSGGDQGDYLNGGTGHDTLYGGTGGDQLYGDGGNDQLYGGADSDILVGESGDDTLRGGEGTDTLYGDNGDATGSGADRLFGEAGNDHLYGHGGDDQLFGGSGNDELQGNDGLDTLSGGSGDDNLFGQGGDDILQGGTGNDYLAGGSGRNSYLFAAGDSGGAGDVVRCGEGQSVIQLDGVELAGIVVEQSPSTDSVKIRYSPTDLLLLEQVGTGAEVSFRLGGEELSWQAFMAGAINTLTGTADDDVITGGSTNDVIAGGAGNDTLEGSGGNDTLYGEVGNDTLSGGAGNDVLVGGAGRDVMSGGEGNDTYVVSPGDGKDFIYDNLGWNTLALQSSRSASNISFVYAAETDGTVCEDQEAQGILVRYQGGGPVFVDSGRVNNWSLSFNDGVMTHAEILAHVERKLQGGDEADTLSGALGQDTLQGGGGGDHLYGHDGEDSLYGDEGDDHLEGGAGDDRLYGGKGDDLLDGGKGADYLDGGEGIDTVSYAAETEDITVVLWEGGRGGSAEGDTYRNIESVIGGKGNDHLTSAGYAVLEGGPGADVLDGNWGYLSTASYRSSSAGVEVSLDTGEAHGGDAEGDRLYKIKNLTGSEFADILVASSDKGLGGTVLHGLGGDDRLIGTENGDLLAGGRGNDLLEGGAGNDSYIFNRGDGIDTIVNSSGEYSETIVKDSFGHERLSRVASSYDRDTLVFGQGITADDLLLYRTPSGENSELGDNDLVIALKDDAQPNAAWNELGDKVIVKGYFNHEVRAEVNIYEQYSVWDDSNWDRWVRYGEYSNWVKRIEFADGTSLDRDELVASLSGGTAGDDHLEMIQDNSYSQAVSWNGLAGNDVLVGAKGDDALWGGEGEDRLDGRGGNNYLDGGSGNDTYVVSNRNTPQEFESWLSTQAVPCVDDKFIRDTLSDEDGYDRVIFESDIAREDIVFTINTGGDLVIDYGLYLQYQMIVSGNGVELFENSDGSTITREQVVSALERIAGRLGVDIHQVSSTDIFNNIELKSELYNSWADQFVVQTGHADWNLFNGRSDNEIVYGGAGVDELLGHSGNDELHGRGSDDLLNGGNGSDRYVFERGDQNDVIWDKELPFITDSYGSYQPDDGDSVGWGQFVTEVHPNEAPSNDSLLLGGDTLGGDIHKDDLEIFWATEMEDPANGGDDLLIRLKSQDPDQAWHDRDVNLAIITDYYDANPLLENVVDHATGETNSQARVVTSDDFAAYGDKALRSLAYRLSCSDEAVCGITDLAGLRSFLDVENGLVGFNREYRATDDTILIRDYFNPALTIEHIVLTDSGEELSKAEIVDLMSTENSEMIRGFSDEENVIHGKGGNDIVRGANLKDTIFGEAGNDQLYGLSGDDTLSGGGGDDALHGGAGADQMSGGVGNDSYYLDSADDVIVEQEDEGSDTVFSSVDYTLGANLEKLVLTGETAVLGVGNDMANDLRGGSGDDRLYGRLGDDSLSGGEGDDILNGGAGADQMSGGVGNDSYYLDSADDVIVEQGDEGVDRVFSAVDHSLGANLERLVLTGETAVLGVGNEMANTISGNGIGNDLRGGAGDDRLYGRLGDDSLSGGEGDDILNGGAGADQMSGGVGNDSYYLDSADDVVVEQGDEGVDRVFSAVDHSLGANLENLVLTGETAVLGVGNEMANTISGNGIGNDLRGGAGDDRLYGRLGDDRLSGGEGDDILNGGAGADQMSGGAGNDSYYLDSADDVIVEQGDEGVDRVFSAVDHSLGANLEKLVLTGETAVLGVGNEMANTISGNGIGNDLRGGSGDDRLYGRLGDDRLSGGEGDDILNGGAGADLMSGGAGNDSYYLDSADDVIVEQGDEGVDRVFSAVDHSLGANLEKLVLTGETAVLGVGNEMANTISGNGIGNDLRGGSGDDRLYGRLGDDSLSGGEGDDILNGGAGADLMSGGVGNDSYYLDSADDVIVEQGDEGVDRVFSSVDHTLGANVEKLKLQGDQSIAGVGNDQDNLIQGNNNDNILNGRSGNDTLKGNGGKDTFVFDSALDQEGNSDVISDFVSGQDKILLDRDIFSALPGRRKNRGQTPIKLIPS